MFQAKACILWPWIPTFVGMIVLYSAVEFIRRDPLSPTARHRPSNLHQAEMKQGDRRAEQHNRFNNDNGRVTAANFGDGF